MEKRSKEIPAVAENLEELCKREQELRRSLTRRQCFVYGVNLSFAAMLSHFGVNKFMGEQLKAPREMQRIGHGINVLCCVYSSYRLNRQIISMVESERSKVRESITSLWNTHPTYDNEKILQQYGVRPPQIATPQDLPPDPSRKEYLRHGIFAAGIELAERFLTNVFGKW